MVYLKLLRVRETLFSLPLAYIGVLVTMDRLPSLKIWVLVTTCLFFARSFGMFLNRIIDLDIDKKNPRTQERLLPSGKVKLKPVILLTIISGLIFVISAFMLNNVCGYLSFLAIFLLVTYHFFKRFSSTTHLYLGLTEACAPIGGGLAVRPEITLPLVILGVFIIFWIAGLDIIYSCQDYQFDKDNKLFSIPVKFGLRNALIISSCFHVVSILSLIILGIIIDANLVFWFGLMFVVALFFWQHLIVKPDNLTNVHIAFFKANSYISLLLLITFSLNYFWRLI